MPKQGPPSPPDAHGPPRARASIDDVAKAAKVSVATVSRVLNNPDLVAPATAARVHKAIDELHYQPNLFAKGLMTRRSNVLAIALPDIFGEFYSELLRGADTEARELGYHLLVSSEARLNHREGPHADGADRARVPPPHSHLAFGLVDGLALMITEPNDALIDEAVRRERPLVVLDVDLRDRGIDSVVVDNTTGTREALRHMLEATPPERCFFVGGPRENFDTAERLDVFTRALAEADHHATPNQVSCGDYEMEFGEQWGRDHARRGALQGAAVLAGNDEIAYGVLSAAQDAGVNVPSGVRIIGFDNSRLSRLARPQLSSVRVPAAEVGAAAIRALVNRLNHPDAPATRELLPTRLVVRDSSRTDVG